MRSRFLSLLVLVSLADPGLTAEPEPATDEPSAPASFAKPETRPTSYEYKFRLSGLDRVREKEVRKRIATALAPLGNSPIGGWDRKKCRFVRFYDTPDDALRKLDFTLRVRRKMNEKRCAEAVRMTSWDVVWKWRGSDTAAAASAYEELKGLAAPDGTAVRAKLELDVALSADLERSILSASGKISPKSAASKQRTPQALSTLAPQSLRPLLTEARLEAACEEPILQSKWELEARKTDPLFGIELIHWTRKGDASPGFLELSFKSEDASLGARLAADVRRQLASRGLLAPGNPTTKTAWSRAKCAKR